MSNRYLVVSGIDANNKEALSTVSAWSALPAFTSTSLMVSRVVVLFFDDAVQIPTCDPFSTSLAEGTCLRPGTSYQLRVHAYVGPTSFYGDTLVASPNDPTFFVQSASVSSIQASSFTVEWLAPRSLQQVTGYRIWASIAEAHNGYDSSLNKTLVYASELRPLSQAQRSVVGPSVLSHTFSGCFRTPDGSGHCIAAWTLYEVYVQPISAAVDGMPAVLTLLTAEAVPVQPTNVSQVLL
jgi:hypothetical protein